MTRMVESDLVLEEGGLEAEIIMAVMLSARCCRECCQRLAAARQVFLLLALGHYAMAPCCYN